MDSRLRGNDDAGLADMMIANAMGQTLARKGVPNRPNLENCYR